MNGDAPHVHHWAQSNIDAFAFMLATHEQPTSAQKRTVPTSIIVSWKLRDRM